MDDCLWDQADADVDFAWEPDPDDCFQRNGTWVDVAIADEPADQAACDIEDHDAIIAEKGGLHARAALQRRLLPKPRVDDRSGIREDILAAADADLDRNLRELRFLRRNLTATVRTETAIAQAP